MRDERRDMFRVHLPTGGGGEEEEERICVSGERKEVAASIKEEVSSQSDVRKPMQREEGREEMQGQEKDLKRKIPLCKLI